MTTELSKPSVAPLNMPKECPPISVGNSNDLNFLLDEGGSAYYYHGNWKDALLENKIEITSIYSVNIMICTNAPHPHQTLSFG